MNNGLFTGSLLCAALGLALASAQRQTLLLALAGVVAISIAAGLVPLPQAWVGAAATISGLSIIVAAACAYLPKGPSRSQTLILTANVGVWTGVISGLASTPVQWAFMLPWVLLCLPVGWMSRRWGRLPLQIAGSWLIAVAVMTTALPLVSVPVSRSDHME